MSDIYSGLDYNDYLAHYGVKGMKWGVRKDKRPSGVSRKTNREARKDAKEYARAKMFYGEGAGNRRKLINNSVKAKSSKDPSYKKAFDHHLKNQDMSKHAEKARSERRAKDTRKNVAKTARGVKNLALKTGANVTLASAAIYTAAQSPTVRSYAQKAYTVGVKQATHYKNRIAVRKWAKANGFL